MQIPIEVLKKWQSEAVLELMQLETGKNITDPNCKKRWLPLIIQLTQKLIDYKEVIDEPSGD